jgi:hypothetical protein
VSAAQRYAAAGLACLGMVATLTAGHLVREAFTQPAPVTVELDQVHTCQEDDLCWDCHAMGNHVCGPVPTFAEVGR